MTDINRLCRMAWVPFALLALVACAPGSDPAKTVERDAGTGAVPARPIAGVAQPASLAEGGPPARLWSCVAPTMVAWTSARWMWRLSRALTHLRPCRGETLSRCRPERSPDFRDGLWRGRCARLSCSVLCRPSDSSRRLRQ